VAPNPFANELFIKSDKPGVINFVPYDIRTNIIIRKQFTGSVILDTHAIPSAFIFLR
jgi:hypothetical protein